MIVKYNIRVATNNKFLAHSFFPKKAKSPMIKRMAGRNSLTQWAIILIGSDCNSGTCPVTRKKPY